MYEKIFSKHPELKTRLFPILYGMTPYFVISLFAILNSLVSGRRFISAFAALPMMLSGPVMPIIIGVKFAIPSLITIGIVCIPFFLAMILINVIRPSKKWAAVSSVGTCLWMGTALLSMMINF
ncbi:MAG: hypothetical protein HZC28_02225 [Spirochaetes bacterium]|nr:hypothetical protein [Spirochaetota bacterium]